MATTEPVTASNDYVEGELCKRLGEIETVINADAICCIHPILQPFDDFVKDQVEDIENKRDNLLVILETEGGSIETTERIADVFRHHYKGEVSFLVPNFAMSAGTILIMSGDRIFMDYYSVLGPIDPQVKGADGNYVLALGYLEKYKELVEKSVDGKLSAAEIAFLLDKFDPAQLHRIEQAREHSVDLLKRWLVQYKFKNWKKTETRGITVTNRMKVARARQIANKLNDTKLWRSHGRGISIQVVRKTLDLVVEDYGEEPPLAQLNEKVRNYHRLLQDYMGRRRHTFAVHTRHKLFAI